MDGLARDVRKYVYDVFVERGAAPETVELASALGATTDEVGSALEQLEDERALVLSPSTRRLWMAHPFSAVPTPFRVASKEDDRSFWANCAWDAVAVPPLLNLDARIETRCAESGESILLEFASGELAESTREGLVHLVVPPRRFWANVGYT